MFPHLSHEQLRKSSTPVGCLRSSCHVDVNTAFSFHSRNARSIGMLQVRTRLRCIAMHAMLGFRPWLSRIVSLKARGLQKSFRVKLFRLLCRMLYTCLISFYFQNFCDLVSMIFNVLLVSFCPCFSFTDCILRCLEISQHGPPPVAVQLRPFHGMSLGPPGGCS